MTAPPAPEPDPREHDPREHDPSLDEALEESFPASDPPASGVPVSATEIDDAHQRAPKPCSVYRVIDAGHADAAFSTGHAHAGRWTSSRCKAVYASLSPAAAVLEYLAHLEGETPDELVLMVATLSGQYIQPVTDVPPDWKERPYRGGVQAIGDRWYTQRTSFALKVPSALAPREYNVLLNPEHPDRARLAILSRDALHIDARLRF